MLRRLSPAGSNGIGPIVESEMAGPAEPRQIVVARPNRGGAIAASIVAVTMILLGIALSGLLLGTVVRGRHFPDDHGLERDAPRWMRCAAETIERHPFPFTFGGFAIARTGDQTARISGSHATFEITVVEGYVVYWLGRGSHLLPLDCPRLLRLSEHTGS
jgi:hypothetical protein